MPFISGPVDFSKPVDRNVLQGKTALITGGASGIGAGLVRALAEAGVAVTIADLNAQCGVGLAVELVEAGYKAIFIPTDVTNWESQVAAFKQTIEHAPNHKIDIVVSCAGIVGPSTMRDLPFSQADPSKEPQMPAFSLRIINVNLIGAMFTSTLAAWYFQQGPQTDHDDNVFIVIASNIAYCPMAGFTAYTAAKSGVRGLFKSLRETPQFANLFRMNLLAPHLVRTPMTTILQPLVEANGLKMVEISDCVECLLRLCCDRDIKGRAVEVNPEGSWFDLCDDYEGGDGVRVWNEHYEKEVKPLFDFVTGPDLQMI